MISGLMLLSAGATLFAGVVALVKVIQARRKAMGKGPWGDKSSIKPDDVQGLLERLRRRRQG